uniref:Chromo domain-containing protein n=1 Tax=Panagrolaimus davidi TaxID=227884 RepID=A0A914Q0X6_9BILA
MAYTVEKILDKKGKGKNVQYFIKWKGYDETNNSWEPKSNCNCPELIQQFEASLHPPYAEMIKEAITELKNRKGSSRFAILKYIKEHYNIPERLDNQVS